MKILVLNCGSSSLKYQFIDMNDEKVLAKGICERISLKDSLITHKADGKEEFKKQSMMETHKEAIKLVMEALLSKEHGVINSIDEISAVGHRVVHGGEHFSQSVVISEDVKRVLEDCISLAPLHNPPNIIGIEACESLMPDIPQVGVFDTAFHQSIPEKAYLYAIPYDLYKKHKIRRYGFHGTSHRFVSKRAAEILDENPRNLKLVTCHLGNGASVCAVRKGVSVDTSMGLTPLEGLVMGTRSGDIDPAVISFIEEKENLTTKEVEDILNKKSGVLGVSGVSSDFRDIETAADNGNERARTALDIFYYRVAKYIGSYAAAMNGLDAIIFTGGLGENSALTRNEITKYLAFLGVKLDKEANKVRSVEKIISSEDSSIKVMVVPTNEELVIARDTKELLDI